MLRRIITVLALLALPAGAWAVEWNTPLTDSVSIVETLRVNYDITNEDQEFWAIVNRLNVEICKGSFIAGLRYDTEAYLLDEEYFVRYVPEKFYVQYYERPLLFRVGDSYVRFGQGLTLSLLKRDEFGEDTTVQGALFKLEHEYFEFETLVGPVNVGDDRRFGPERARTEEPGFFDERDLIWGARIMGGAPGVFRGGFAWVGGNLRAEQEGDLAQFDEDDDINLYSLMFEAPVIGSFGAADGEYAWLEYTDNRDQRLGDIEYEGRGAHLATTWYLGPVTLLAEGTDYFRFDYPYNDPPSMEYPEESFGHLPNYDDAIGARGRVDYTIPGAELGVFVNYTNIQTHEGIPLELADHYSSESPWLEWIEHTYGGFDRTFGNGLYLTGKGGYREAPEGRFVHGDIKVDTPIISPHSVNAEWRVKQFHSFDETQFEDALTWSTALGYAWAPYVTLTGLYEWSDEPAVLELGARPDDDENFWAVESTIQPADWTRISLAYGRYKGGLKCAGGVCRQIPPFEGFKSEFAFFF
ncbi:MAG: DUF6029 family protein [Candidatus Lernaella stagnicola]|nr:DUF6029 family protein [Candidatus Lernaella stagnicola]